MIKKAGSQPATADNDLGQAGLPLCREPWESYYILRRGIMPCCYGNPIIGRMTDYAEVWNSPQLQEIRRYLSQGKLSPYCLESLSCPIVQRVLSAQDASRRQGAQEPLQGQAALRIINRLLFRIPGKVWRVWKRR